MATLDELKAKLQSIINEYKAVSKEKNKVFGKTAANIDKYYFIIQDGQLSQNSAGQWTAKRTITAMVVTDVAQKNGYSNVYAEVLGANGQPVLVSPAQADGEIPATAKDAKDKNLLALAAKLKENSSTSYTVDLIWDIANPNDKPNPNPQEPFYYEIVDSDFKEEVKDQKWTAKRTITKKSAAAQGAKNVYKNVYTSALVGGQPKTLNGEGDLPNGAKSRNGRSFKDLIPKMNGKESYTVELVWDGKPSDEEVQRALNNLRGRGITAIQLNTPTDNTSDYPTLVKQGSELEGLRTIANLIIILKQAGYSSFRVNLVWTMPNAMARLLTNTQLDQSANTACSEFIRGLVMYSNGRLKSSDFQINATGIFSGENGSFVSSITPLR